MALVNRDDSQQFNYTGGIQTLAIQTKGLYKLEVYGGRGGGNSAATGYGRNGGYSIGYKELNVGDILYIVCGGGNNNTYNGGGLGDGTSYSGHGGGATHIAKITGTLAQVGSLYTQTRDYSNIGVYGATNNWLQVTFANPVKIYRYSGNNASDSSYSRSWDMTLKGSNDGTTWTDIQTNNMSATGTNTIDVNVDEAYLYYRWYFSRYNNTYQNGRYLFDNLQIYFDGSNDNVLIVAGGGGGGAESDDGGTTKYAGNGGGISGGNASGGSWNGLGGLQYKRSIGYNGQTNVQSHPETVGTFGQGGRSELGRTSGSYYGGGGGGGYYGGGGGSWSGNKNSNGAGGGGSGYIGGVPPIEYNGTTYTPSMTNGSNSGSGYAIITLIDYLPPEYEITLDYDARLGSASYTVDSYTADQIDLNLSATANPNAFFVGWYINSQLISSDAEYTYTATSDVTIEARFGRTYNLNTSVVGQGSIDYYRYGIGNNDVTITVIPNANWHFLKYEIIGLSVTEANLITENDDYIVTQNDDIITVLAPTSQEVYTTPLNITLPRDVSVIAYFEEDEKYHITIDTNFEYGSVYISDNDVYAGTVVTLWARPFPDYYFVKWSDNDTSNPRQITVNSNITLVAEYQRVLESNGIYQYRCFVKDQMNMTDPPKAFMMVDTFDVNTDLLTNATSSITVISIPSNIDEGDVLVLYDPKGQFLYNGVITSIEDLTINCSQMQSFYRGTWIYNVNPQDYLEHEIAVLLQSYAQGRLYNSSYVDPQVAQRLGGITIDYVGSIVAKLPTEVDDEGNEEMNTYDMEEWIYELYQKYSIIFDFEINFSGANYVHIKVPTYSTVAVGNNMYAISDMSPITEIEETNKLVIFANDKTYRTTYIATKTGIVEAPSTTAQRFNITNTEVVFSDDDLSDLVANNLPNTMYNHKLTFTLIIKNFIYEFGEFNLGGALDVYYDDDYYNSVLTGYQIVKENNRNITEAYFTCGKVRVALTKMLTLGKI